jgi:carbamoyl-phosphate synthase large subunit
MLEICDKHDVGLIVPTIDPELAVYARHREAFEARGTRVAVSSDETISIAADKRTTHAWLSEQGFPTVEQLDYEEFIAGSAPWSYPVATKPAAGSRSIGFAIVDDSDELRACADSSYVVQTVAPGDEYTVSIYVGEDGSCQCAVPRKRLEVRAGEVSKGMAVRNPQIQSLAKRVGEALPGAFGAMNVQIFWDEATGETNIIEINPRFGGGFPLAWNAGADFPKWLIEDAFELEPSERGDHWEDGLLMLRYDDAVYLSAEQGKL